MAISQELQRSLNDALNRLATESILAQSGREEALVPSYSLLGDLCGLCADEPLLLAPVAAARARLEQLLDAGAPFNDPTLTELRALVEWLPTALSQLRAGKAVPAMGASVVSVATRAPAVEPPLETSGEDLMLELNFGENRELLAEFYAESVDHLQQIEAALLALDQRPDNPAALASLFRSFHTLKGNAAFLGLIPMHRLAHEVESLLDLARNEKLRLTAPIITHILGSRDALHALTHQVGSALEKGRLPDQIVPVSHLIEAIRLQAQLATRVADDTNVAPSPRGIPDFDAAAYLVTLPPFAFDEHRAEAPAAVEVGVESFALAPEGVPWPAARPRVPVVQGAASKPPVNSGGKPGRSSATVRVNTEKLDSVMDLVGELVILQSQLLNSSRLSGTDNPTLQLNVAQLGRITKELQSTATALRMIPIKATFQKMERLVRDLARDLGKKVAFSTSGDETELDRTVIEEIGDPLVHMVRNALDHGLESMAERINAGKAETGQVHLRAYHQAGNIVIELRDDGRGIDPDRIYRKAVQIGLIATGTQLTRDQILALLFAPGFSTAERITPVSGRGVGMDVVKQNIEKLRGKIEISSELHGGSVFRIKLPLTMAIIDGLVVRVGEERFILPTSCVQMALRPARAAISTVHGRGELLDLRGRFVPIHRLHRRFGIAHEAVNPWEGVVVVIEDSGKTTALLVDEMVSMHEVVIKNLGAFMQNVPGVAGAAILGDGHIALILDPTSLLNAA